MVHEQYFKEDEKAMIKVCATLSQLKNNFDELKVVSVTGIWNNVKKEKRKGSPRMSKQ